MINWRCIKDVGFPKDINIKYLVTDGNDISTSDITGNTHYKGDNNPIFTFTGWTGDDNTWEDNSCCSGTPKFDMMPTHWCPIDELNLPDERKIWKDEIINLFKEHNYGKSPNEIEFKEDFFIHKIAFYTDHVSDYYISGESFDKIKFYLNSKTTYLIKIMATSDVCEAHVEIIEYNDSLTYE